MPYVKQERRNELAHTVMHLEHEASLGVFTEGDLNYLITKLIWAYWQREQKYHTIARISGVLSNVESEFYRRIAIPYENAKMAENGDVYN